MRNAIDLAKIKSQHSDFFYKLQRLNDKIMVFQSIFYNRMPRFQRSFLRKKTLQLEKTIKVQKKMLENQMQQLEAKVEKRTNPLSEGRGNKKSSNDVTAMELLQRT